MMYAPAVLLALSVILLLVHIFLQAFLATRELGREWNASARDDKIELKSVMAGRAERASRNFRETYPAFIALVMVPLFKVDAIMLTMIGGWIWFLARLIYIPLYLAGIPYIRSLVWLMSVLGLVIMLAVVFI